MHQKMSHCNLQLKSVLEVQFCTYKTFIYYRQLNQDNKGKKYIIAQLEEIGQLLYRFKFSLIVWIGRGTLNL